MHGGICRLYGGSDEICGPCEMCSPSEICSPSGICGRFVALVEFVDLVGFVGPVGFVGLMGLHNSEKIPKAVPLSVSASLKLSGPQLTDETVELTI